MFKQRSLGRIQDLLRSSPVKHLDLSVFHAVNDVRELRVVVERRSPTEHPRQVIARPQRQNSYLALQKKQTISQCHATTQFICSPPPPADLAIPLSVSCGNSITDKLSTSELSRSHYSLDLRLHCRHTLQL